jgi:EF-P beta-lysylation protein EpmB
MHSPPPLWRKIQLQNFTRLAELFQFLQLEKKFEKAVLQSPKFPLNLPRRLANKIQKNTLSDPILRQFLPLLDEDVPTPSFSTDPVQDLNFRKEAKLLQKYTGRALILATSACAMHCRFCFRQNFPYESKKKDFEEEIKQIRQNQGWNEVILSGGDPLSLPDPQLHSLLTSLENIPHIKRIRFHTRFPIGIPERIDSSFLSLLSTLKKQIFFVIHVNHPRELDPEIFAALKSVSMIGIPILSQTVLLKDINDDTLILQELFETLCDHGVVPYYLHQLDKIQGGSHFEVPIAKGKQLITDLRKKVSGYAIPRYMQEIPGKESKTEIPVSSF